MDALAEYTTHKHAFIRARESVRRKIMKVYDLSESEVLPKELGERMAKSIQRFTYGRTWLGLGSNPWQQACKRQAAWSSITFNNELRETLSHIAQSTLTLYTHAFALRRMVFLVYKPFQLEHPFIPPYNKFESADQIMDVYVNHITIELLSHLRHLGFSERSVMSLSGALIKESVQTGFYFNMEKWSYVSPQKKGLLSPLDANNPLEHIAGYGKTLAGKLAERYRNPPPKNPGHTR